MYARNLWKLWAAPDFLSPSERIALDHVEEFDEWEEFALFGTHYVLLTASNIATTDSRAVNILNKASSSSSSTESIRMDSTFSEYSKLQGQRRFAGAVLLKSPDRTIPRIGNFAGMGLNTRVNSCDVYTTDALGDVHVHDHAAAGPSPRMCHTITDLGEEGSLLVGGRTSPDKALAECWLYHKWTNTWERVDDLPQPRYRHAALAIGNGCVLVLGGKRDSRALVDDANLIWSRRRGWVSCTNAGAYRPESTFGPTLTLSHKDPNNLNPTASGFLAGGITIDGLLSEKCQSWRVQDYMGEVSRSRRSQPGGHFDSRHAIANSSTVSRAVVPRNK